MTPIEKLNTINFLSVCDVAMDIKEELQMTKHNSVQIPVLRNIIRPAPFNQLLPVDSENLRDDYGEYRIKALDYLRANNYILSYRILDSDIHRWEDEIQVSIARKDFDNFYKHLIKVYRKRVVKPHEKQDQIDKQKNAPEKTVTDYVVEVLSFFRDEYNKTKIMGLEYRYPLRDDPKNKKPRPFTESELLRQKAIENLLYAGLIISYGIEWDYAICTINEHRLIEAPPATDKSVKALTKKIIHEHTHHFENNIQEKPIDLNHQYEKDYKEPFYITKNRDDFQYKGKELNLSKNNDYYKVFCALYAKLPEGGEIKYKELISEIKSRIPKIKSRNEEEMRKFIQTNLTDRSNGFMRYAKIPQTEDNGKPLIEIMRASGIRFNNKAG